MENSEYTKETSLDNIEDNDDQKAQNQNSEKIIDTSQNKQTYKPKIKIDPKRQRYPYCLVWTPLPCFTWFIPCIGHVGICSSEGIIHDFAGPYYVSIDDMAFGNPTKYLMLDLSEKEYDEYDKAVEVGTADYKKESYNFCCNNCHSFVAHCLNKLNYKNKNSYTMINVWWMFIIKGKYISCTSFIQSYIGFFVLVFFGVIIYLLTK